MYGAMCDDRGMAMHSDWSFLGIRHFGHIRR